MKLLNIFKKETKSLDSKIQSLDKKLLEKVIGGGDGITTLETDSSGTSQNPKKVDLTTIKEKV